MFYVSPCPDTGYTVNDFYAYSGPVLPECCISGNTVEYPHPAFAVSSPTDPAGNCVAYQMNAVLLGGLNGLNS